MYNIHTLSESREKQVFDKLFWHVSQRVQSNFYIYWQCTYVYCVYPAMLKSPKQLPNCLKRAETYHFQCCLLSRPL